jgi:8-oxo-dGTP diphosphatase
VLSRDSPRPLIHVVAGVVIDAAERVLIAQRPTGKHLAGGWEFPGGKLEPGEERLAGLARELREEIGIEIALPRPLIRVRHAYPSREVLLDVWVVRRFGGEPRGLDGQALRWCTQDELATAELLPADKPIVAALRLPERLIEMSSPYYVICNSAAKLRGSLTDDCDHDTRLHGMTCASSDEARAAAAAGADFLVLREPLSMEECAALCASVAVPLYVRGLELGTAWTVGASGTNELGA